MKRHPRQLYVILAIIVIGGLSAIVLAQVVSAQLNAGSEGEPRRVTFTIQSNESVNSIADRLHEEGLIRSPTYFRLRIQFSGRDGDIVAGQFDLSSDMSTAQIIDTITSEEAVSFEETTVTFLEGWRVEQYAEALVEAGLLASEDEFIEATFDGRWNAEYSILHSRPSGSGLEGYLFPDTYTFRDDATPHDMIAAMLDNFDTRVTPEMRASVEALGMSFHQAVIMASIVEREAALDSERPLIASVYYNRYVAGMPLQADPTVQYQLGESGDWWPVISGADLQEGGSYNTYLNPGLPPGPICNPGLEAMRAAFAPEPSDYLYFVARGDGSHAFAETFEEHQDNINRYQN